jgi:hypothetical protein
VRPGRPVVINPGRPTRRVVVGRPGFRYRPGYRVVYRHERRYAPWRPRTIVSRYYPFEWRRLTGVACYARDSYGYTYSVAENRYFGESYQSRMVEVENDALARCYAESGGDTGCYVYDCDPVYSSTYNPYVY